MSNAVTRAERTDYTRENCPCCLCFRLRGKKWEERRKSKIEARFAGNWVFMEDYEWRGELAGCPSGV